MSVSLGLGCLRRYPTSTYNVKCDESGATGESDAIKKVSFDECMALKRKAEEDGTGGEDARGLAELGHMDCFVVSGSNILEGIGAMLLLLLGRRF
jgi:Ca2+-transporting ATPase